jgi:hypothetical protein
LEFTVKVTKPKASVGGAAMLAAAVMAGTLAAGPATADGDGGTNGGTHTHGRLNPLNNSGVTGNADIHVKHRRLRIEVDARALAEKLPHAQHVHFGRTARHECPTVADDDNGDFRLTTSEGAPAYGPVRVSLTNEGSTGPGSVLAVDRFPTAPRGQIHYDRNTRTTKAVARAIRSGEAVVVIHGVDYNDNGKYDFRSAGKSELDPSLPAEATDPATCGVLHAK